MSEERPWLKHYAKGVAANIDPDADTDDSTGH